MTDTSDTLDKKYFIITVGATGSGKTPLIDKTMEHLGIKGQEYSKILVDDLVEKDPKYKEQVKKIIEEVDNACKSNIECDKNNFENPSEDLLKKFETAYYNSRKNPGCLVDVEKLKGCEEKDNTNIIKNFLGIFSEKDNNVSKNVSDEKNTCLNCDDLNDKNLLDAIGENKHIILETTGEKAINTMGWLFNSDWIPKHYTVVFSYTLVSLEELKKRNKFRAFDSIVKFKESNYKNNAPRFPDVRDEVFKKKVDIIKTNLIDLYDSCIIRNDTECGNNNNRLLIFDNNSPLEDNKAVFRIIFDSEKIKELNNNLNIIISPSFGEKTKDSELREPPSPVSSIEGGIKMGKQKKRSFEKRATYSVRKGVKRKMRKTTKKSRK